MRSKLNGILSNSSLISHVLPVSSTAEDVVVLGTDSNAHYCSLLIFDHLHVNVLISLSIVVFACRPNVKIDLQCATSSMDCCRRCSHIGILDIAIDTHFQARGAPIAP